MNEFVLDRVCAFDTGFYECLICVSLCLHIVFRYLSIVPQKGHHQKTQRQGSMSRISHLSFVLMREMGLVSPKDAHGPRKASNGVSHVGSTTDYKQT